MKSLAAVAAALLVTVGAANAGEIVISPKGSDRPVVLTIRGGKVVQASGGSGRFRAYALAIGLRSVPQSRRPNTAYAQRA
jgi:hypothetical protein